MGGGLERRGRCTGRDEARSAASAQTAETAREEAEKLARRLTEFPQTCLRNDRRSVYEQEGLTEEEALRFEIGVGMESLRADGTSGAARFSAGAGRHGSFS